MKNMLRVSFFLGTNNDTHDDVDLVEHFIYIQNVYMMNILTEKLFMIYSVK